MTTEASAAHWIAVLPWLQLSSAVGIGDVRFLPVDATQPQANLPELASVAADCAQVLRTFRVSPKHSITTCTFIVPDGWDPEAPADEAAQARLIRLSNLLMLSAFSANSYGHQNAWNANARMFETVVATFSSPPGYLPITRRERDRFSQGVGAKWGDPLFQVPTECNPPVPVSVDKRLAKALGHLGADHRLSQRLRLALPFFSWANMLSETSAWEMETIALVAALEALLGTSGRYSLVKEVRRLLDDYGSITVREAQSSRPKISPRGRHAREQPAWPLHAFLVFELYDIRNGLAHAGAYDTEAIAWAPFEHLAMGAFLFPLLVKLMLAEDGRYDLTWQDKAALDAIDLLLAEPVWFNWGHEVDNDGNGAATAWAATLDRAKRARFQREAAAISRRFESR